MLTDFAPKSVGMVHVINMRELVDNDIVAERLWYFHEADIERDGARTATAAPARVGVRKTEAGVFVAIFGRPKFKAIREIFAGFLRKDLDRKSVV